MLHLPPNEFQSTLPVWGATSPFSAHPSPSIFQSTLPVWGATPSPLPTLRHQEYFNPRSPCGERPGWRAGGPPGPDFNPRSPCGERRGGGKPRPNIENFNPRSPCGERRINTSNRSIIHRFQSTLPVWGATAATAVVFVPPPISIHAPRVGSDNFLITALRTTRNFNPRSPCGERLFVNRRFEKMTVFQSTLPVWGATLAALVGHCLEIYFNPRSPCGERLPLSLRYRAMSTFQSTLPVWGATRTLYFPIGAWGISIHAPRVGSDPG